MPGKLVRLVRISRSCGGRAIRLAPASVASLICSATCAWTSSKLSPIGDSVSTAMSFVDQDTSAGQAVVVSSADGVDVIAKPLSNGDVSVVLFNEGASSATVATSITAIGKTGASAYALTNLWTGQTATTSGAINATIPSHDVVMYRVSGGSTTLAGGAAFLLRGTGSNRCLDVPNSTWTNGERVEIWDCNGGVNQWWTLTAAGQLQVDGTRCLDVYDNQTAAGTAVELWDCNGQSNQQWRFNSDGSITSVQSGRCLDVTGAAVDDGTLMEIWDCNGQSNQRWTRG